MSFFSSWFPNPMRPMRTIHTTQPLIAQLERQIGGPVLTFWCSDRIPIHGEHVEIVGHMLREMGPSRHLYLALKSTGGNGEAALRLVHLLRSFCDELTVLVPSVAASAATLLALGADHIRMGPGGYLTAIDTSLSHELSPVNEEMDRVSVSLDSLKRATRLWQEASGNDDQNVYEELFKHLHPLLIGEMDRGQRLSLEIAQEALTTHLHDPDSANALAHHFNGDYPSHSFPITWHRIQQLDLTTLGLDIQPLNPGVEATLSQLFRVYATMAEPKIHHRSATHIHRVMVLSIMEQAMRQCFDVLDRHSHWVNQTGGWEPRQVRDGWHEIHPTGPERRIYLN